MVFDSCVQGLKAPLFIHLYVLYINKLRGKGSCSSGWKEAGEKTAPTGKRIFLKIMVWHNGHKNKNSP